MRGANIQGEVLDRYIIVTQRSWVTRVYSVAVRAREGSERSELPSQYCSHARIANCVQLHSWDLLFVRIDMLSDRVR